MDNFALKRSRSMGFDDSHRPAEMIKEREEEEARLALERASLNTNNNSTATQSNDQASSISSAEDDTDTHEISSVSSPELEATDPTKTAVTNSAEAPVAPVHDDSDVHYEPSRHVDYLSHDWKESDISSSWRYIVLRRKEVANSARLENASWRTWAKAKYNLKTVSPESVNWLKDYDVTWLYGPLCRTSSQANISGVGGAAAGDATPTASSDKDEHGAAGDTKSILKKRSATEMILALPPMRRSKDDSAVTPAAIAAAGDDKDKVVKSYFRHHQYRQKNPYGMTDEEVDTLADKLNAQYKLPPKNKSTKEGEDASVTPSATPSRDELVAPPPTANKDKEDEEATPVATVAPPTVKPKRRIHFNSEVQQCISLDYVSSEEEDQYDSDSDDSDSDSDELDEDDDEPGLFLMVRSSSSASMHRPELSGMARGDQPGSGGRRGSNEALSDESDNEAETDPLKAVRTIAPIPPTSLKYAYDEDPMDAECNAIATVHSAVSHNNSRRRDYAHYDYNSVYQAPVSKQQSNESIIPKAPYMESPSNSLTPSPTGSPESSPKPKYMDILEQVRQAQAALAAQPIEVRTQETDKNIVGTVSEVATLDGLISDSDDLHEQDELTSRDENDSDNEAKPSGSTSVTSEPSESSEVLPKGVSSPKRSIATTATPTTSTSTENVSGLIDEKEDRPKAFRSASADSTSSMGSGSSEKRLIDKAKDMASNLLGWGSASSGN
ncbi:Resistance to glucose repression protein 1 [Yarrowia sp. C11]|nr:Resistance to glucose repression protein 1 [Yarrowia sp. E02]KAG5372644.1 Resistance to glucose repression protein 1 [Yarrowia sp. C11]